MQSSVAKKKLEYGGWRQKVQKRLKENSADHLPSL